MNVLSQVKMFQDFGPQRLSDIVDCMQYRKYPADTVICREGDAGNAFCVLTAGQCAVEKDGRQAATIEAGEFFGESAMVEAGQCIATVRTVAECAVLSLTREQISEESLSAEAVAQLQAVRGRRRSPRGALAHPAVSSAGEEKTTGPGLR